MSIWFKVKDIDDIEISEDGETLEVFVDSNYDAFYVDIPIWMIDKVLNDKESNVPQD